jgi:predicted DNA-binding transcriptional regulator AlpA
MQSRLLDRREVCRYFGGNRPINASTLYRGIRKGTYPKPLKVGGSILASPFPRSTLGFKLASAFGPCLVAPS